MKKIIAIALCAALGLSFAACGGNAEDTTAETAAGVEILTGSDAATVEDAVKALSALFDLLKAGDIETIVALSGSDAPMSDELLMEMLVAMFAKLDYTFGAPVVDGNTAVVPASITSVSITTVFMEYMNEAAKHVDDENWDSDGSYFIELCKSDKIAPVTTDIKVNFELVDGAWTTSADNAELVSALFGGLL